MCLLFATGVAGAVKKEIRHHVSGVGISGGVQNLRDGSSLHLELLLGELEPRLGLHERRERLHSLQEFLLYLEAIIEASDQAHGQLFVGDGAPTSPS